MKYSISGLIETPSHYHFHLFCNGAFAGILCLTVVEFKDFMQKLEVQQ